MSQLKCKMCGGTLNIEQNQTVIECEFCGTKQTVPNIDNEKRMNLHNRANSLRLSSSFDKAIVTYENIIEEFPDDAEAHWGLVLCRYGIEYVDDPTTKKKIPTCHRAQYKPIFEDIDYKAALEHCDVLAKKIYQEEAEEINKIQKSILAISQKEAPYDVFICYKESDRDGKRTRDSVIAQEIYNTLTDKNYKVFFAKISLESKLGSQYEPYIFSALNTAKVMLVIGTKAEYFNAPWVKNEWARYLELLGDNKKFIIPCYRDMDVYELPDELVSFQSQDMNKLGFIQDLVRGIDKIFNRRRAEDVQMYNQPIYQNGVNVTALIKRSEILISDRTYDKAEQLIEEVLNNDPTNAKAYVLLLLMELGIAKEDDLFNYPTPLDSYGNYQKALEFADEDYKEVLRGYNNTIKNRIHENNMIAIYKSGKIAMENKLYDEAISIFESIIDYQDSQYQLYLCKNAINDNVYNNAIELLNKQYYAAAIEQFKLIKEYKDSSNLIDECIFNINEITYQTAKNLINAKRYLDAIEELNKILEHKDANDLIEICETMLLKDKTQKYQLAVDNVSKRNYDEAIKIFQSLGDFEDSKQQLEITKGYINKEKIYVQANEIAKVHKIGELSEAVKKLKSISDYRDSLELVKKYELIIRDLKDKAALKRDKVKRFFKIFIPSLIIVIILLVLTFTYFIPSSKYNKAKKYMETSKYDQAEEIFEGLKFKDSKNQIKLIDAYIACEDGDYNEVIKVVCNLKGKVNVVYDANGGNSPLGSETFVSAKEIANEPTKAGYKFDGWELCDYKIINKNNKYQFTLTLKAKWLTDVYTIKYELNGGVVDEELVYSYDKDSEFTLPNPVKEGYTFEGWHNSITNNTTKNVTIKVGSSGNIVFTAIFKANDYVITFDVNGGSCSTTTLNVTYDKNYTLPVPTRNYYEFKGWYYNDTKLISNSLYKIDSSITVEAKWEPKLFTITYNLNGGENDSKNPSSYSCETNIILASPTKQGYTFIGWSIGSSSEIYESYKLHDTTPEPISLTAHWEANKYTIKFNAKGGTCSTANKTLTFDAPCTLPTPTRNYYEFIGWYYNDVKLSETKYNIVGDVTVEAKWEAKPYFITYNLNGGKNSASNPSVYTCETNITLQSPTKTGYTFKGWSEGASSTIQNPYVLKDSTPTNITLTANWTANTYKITFATNGGNSITAMTVTYDKYYTLPTPVKEGYVFECWTITNSSSGTIIKSGTWKKTSNITIYAQWKPLKTIDDFSDEILSVMNKYSSSTGVTTKAKYFAGTSDENLKRAFSDKNVLKEYKWLFEYGLEVVDEAAAAKPSIKTVILTGTNAGYAYDNIKKLLNDLINEDTGAILTSNVDGRCFLKELIHEIINKGEESAALPNYPQFIVDYSKQAKQDDFLDIYAKICEERQ